MKNIITTAITADDRAKIGTALDDLETALANKTGILTEDERKRYGSVNEQNKLIVNKAREYRQNQPAMSAPGVDWDEFESDFQTRVFLENCINRLAAMVYSLEGTKMMHDYDNLQDSLKDYGYAQYQHGAGEPGYSAKVDEYKQFFTKSNKPKPPANDDNQNDGGNS